MLIWVCALHCEAKPVIDRYRLKKSHAETAFDLYLGEDTICIVSGVGKLASASACAWIAGHQGGTESLAWINLGTAGAAEQAIGSVHALHQVIDDDSGLRYYPAPGAASTLPGAACVTLTQPSSDYRNHYLFDMEASGFMHSALRFSSAELVQSLKVISDNQHEHSGRQAQKLSDLIHAAMPAIVQQADGLIELEQAQNALLTSIDSWQQLLALTRFSQTQQNRARGLWRYLLLRDYDADEMLLELRRAKSAGAIIEWLEQKSRRDGDRL